MSSILLNINSALALQFQQRTELRNYQTSLRDIPTEIEDLTLKFIDSTFFSEKTTRLDEQTININFEADTFAEIHEKRKLLSELKSEFKTSFYAENHSISDANRWSADLVDLLDELYYIELLYSSRVSSYQSEKVSNVFRINTLTFLFICILFIVAYYSKRKTLTLINRQIEEEIEEKNSKLRHSEKVLISIMEDANKEKDKAIALIRENNLLIAIVKQSKNPVLRVALSGIIIDANSAAKSIINSDFLDSDPTHILSLFSGSEKDTCLELFEEATNTDLTHIFEASNVKIRSTIKQIFEVTLFGLRDQSQEICEVAISFQDITERKHNETLFPLLVEASPSAMIMVSQDGKIDFVNSQAEKLFGYLKEELLDQHIELLIPQRFTKNHPDLRNEFFDKPQSRSMGVGRDLFGLRKDGSEFPLEIGLSIIETSAGIKVLSAIIDLTERKKYITELMRTNEELEKFAYVASHDLKAPLRAVDQLARWIEEDLSGKLEEDTTNHLRLMRSRIDRMGNLLADLLEFSRSGRILGTIEQVNTDELIRGVFELGRVDERFELELAGEFPTIETHKAPLELVFRNLISNALKHHDKDNGKISIKCATLGTSLMFSVADDGPGIEIEHRDRVFDMFQTLRPRDEVEGSGMGLAIVKKTIESFGGLITLTPNKPRGSIFSFSWPKQVDSSPP
ncbi:hypothetical protein NBRC116493_26200 [Aurantivibrio infirmus]